MARMEGGDTTPRSNKYSIGEQYHMYRDCVIFFSECFSAFLDLQTLISADFDDCHSQQPFRNSFLRQHTFDDLHVYTRDLF